MRLKTMMLKQQALSIPVPVKINTVLIFAPRAIAKGNKPIAKCDFNSLSTDDINLLIDRGYRIRSISKNK